MPKSRKKYKKILVTGGAGFIGSHIVDLLIKKGYAVRVLDNLDPQVHPGRKKPSYLNPQAEFVKGNVTKVSDLKKALSGVDAIFHEAAKVGVGQSMYEIASYTKNTVLGTALLLDLVVNQYRNKIKKMVVAASMSSYGEGKYKCPKHKDVRPMPRPLGQMQKKDWELHCPFCNQYLKPAPTNEETKQVCGSVYAVNKRDQEEMFLAVGKAYHIPTVALRYFNVYGPRQSLSNPYTGVAAIFMSRIKNDNPPIVYEDGLQTRDFISVHDIASANLKVLENSKADYQVFNIGSGKPQTIAGIAKTLAKLYKSDIKPKVQNQFRAGDIRHCIADIKKIRKLLNWQPKVTFYQGMQELIIWSRESKARDLSEQAEKELKTRKLI